MSRAALFVAMISLAPEACTKAFAFGEKKPATTQDVPPPIVPATATAPPIWTPPPDPNQPQPTPTASSSSAPPGVSAELAKARTLAAAGDNKKLRALLEKKAKAGKTGREETQILLDACTALKDKACIEIARKQLDTAP